MPPGSGVGCAAVVWGCARLVLGGLHCAIGSGVGCARLVFGGLHCATWQWGGVCCSSVELH